MSVSECECHYLFLDNYNNRNDNDKYNVGNDNEAVYVYGLRLGFI